jgi:hypothetical protein
MKAIFGIVGLLLTLVIVALVAKKQLAATRQPVPALQAPASQVPGLPTLNPNASAKEQSQQIQQQYKQALDAAMQARPMPDEK